MLSVAKEKVVLLINDQLKDEIGVSRSFVNCSLSTDKYSSENKNSIYLNNGYIDIGSLLLGGQDWTIMFWRKQYSSRRYGRLLNIQTSRYTQHAGLFFDFVSHLDRSSGRLSIETSWGQWDFHVIQNNVWHHYCLAYSHGEGALRFFHDGILQATIRLSMGRSNFVQAYIGKSAYPADWLDHAVWNNILIADGICLYKTNFVPDAKISFKIPMLYITRDGKVFGCNKTT